MTQSKKKMKNKRNNKIRAIWFLITHTQIIGLINRVLLSTFINKNEYKWIIGDPGLEVFTCTFSVPKVSVKLRNSYPWVSKSLQKVLQIIEKWFTKNTHRYTAKHEWASSSCLWKSSRQCGSSLVKFWPSAYAVCIMICHNVTRIEWTWNVVKHSAGGRWRIQEMRKTDY